MLAELYKSKDKLWKGHQEEEGKNLNRSAGTPRAAIARRYFVCQIRIEVLEGSRQFTFVGLPFYLRFLYSLSFDEF